MMSERLLRDQLVVNVTGSSSAPTSTDATPAILCATPITRLSHGGTSPGPLTRTHPAEQLTDICASPIFGCATRAACTCAAIAASAMHVVRFGLLSLSI